MPTTVTSDNKHNEAIREDEGQWRSSWSAYESLCVERLSDALGTSPRVFNRQLRDGEWDRTHGTEDLTSTAISVIGLSRSGHDEMLSAQKSRVLDDTLQLARRRQYAGGFGLLLWANAVYWGLDFSELITRSGTQFDDVDNHFKSLTTMEAAWLTSGLLHQFQHENNSQLSEAVDAAIACLISRFSRTGDLFFHSDGQAALKKRLRRNVPNFADQIYSVQALAFAALTVQSDQRDEALNLATRTATRLTQLQGELGQWWWHYDARSGKTAKTYPVYSVHQHAMAPMALMAVGSAGGPTFGHAISKSLSWIATNETHIDMLDKHAGTIWRDIEPPGNGVTSAVANLASIAGVSRNAEKFSETMPDTFVRNHETRPYEWGWCLYAQAIAEQRSKQRHLL